mmetsp:Transcript_16182/g.28346  ORF Transcript_16182/g.28346 Transcript_16182/m.28346 type:complete len:96 (+) Transcript_16182:406-693(+)|eukprot:CAMPEP_0184700522 /NCGR_PEP_ID=MMETSP0313-20130426/14078_1 /TAXON_ID=2792 /ORGANISM="Porphyridium aerugineum, Strain SAG 1380-2" /LENGTH=95 /DNA_ID=CAMNT_0027160237 /DNA_START=285 /DNA_END=572 /DNA_ORIENTATION=+
MSDSVVISDQSTGLISQRLHSTSSDFSRQSSSTDMPSTTETRNGRSRVRSFSKRESRRNEDVTHLESRLLRNAIPDMFQKADGDVKLEFPRFVTF